jgi:hypothetical protein
MRNPVTAKVLDRIGKRGIDVSDEDGRLVLAAIRMEVVAVAESVCIVISDHCTPVAGLLDFKLYGKANDALSDSLVGAPNARTARLKLNKPRSLDRRNI